MPMNALYTNKSTYLYRIFPEHVIIFGCEPNELYNYTLMSSWAQ